MAIVRRLALSLAIIVNLLAASAAWGAASCPPAHEPQLSGGSATPASGTTATVFTFTVTYADTKGCAPNSVSVTVAGVGLFQMTGSGTSYETGVVFSTATTLPVGTHTYSFAASSGDPGSPPPKTTAITAVSPPSVTVNVPATPPPTPSATPKPTSVPTPVPTPKPPSVPTPVPTSAPAGATAAPQSTPAAAPGSNGQGPTPSVGGGGAGGPAASPSAGGEVPAPAASGSEGPAPAIVTQTGRMDSFALVVGGWATATAGGLALFLFVATRRRREEEPEMAVAGAGTAVAETNAPEDIAPPPSKPVPQSTLVPPDEVGVPRWLRPSVRAARQGQLGRSQKVEDS
jgi:hypothetical protein